MAYMKGKGKHFRLSNTDCKVIAVAQKDFRLSVKEISTKARLRHHSVSHSLRRLKDSGIIKPYLLTNLHSVGLTDYCIFFNYIGEEKKARQKIVDFCNRSPRVAYFAELTGAFQYSVSLFCRTIFEVTDFFEKLRKILPRSSFDKSFAIRLEFTQFLGKLFSPDLPPTILSRTKVAHELSIDAVDQAILAFYSQNAELSLREVSSHVGISESAIRYRLKGLEQKKVIIAFPYLFDSAKIGITSFRILFSAKGLTEKFQNKIFAFAKSHPNCVIFVRCIGAWDFELNFEVESSSEIGPIVESFHDNFANNIRAIRTLSEIEVHRGHHFPFIDT